MAEQHMVALARANEVRLARAKLKREISDGARTLVELLGESPEVLQTATVAEMLMYQPRWGAQRTSRMLRRLDISESRRLRDTTERQRRLLIGLLSA